MPDDSAGGAAAPPGPPQDDLKRVAQRSRENQAAAAPPAATADLRQEERIDYRQDIALRRKYANAFMLLVVCQVLIADGIFLVYAWQGVGWKVDASVMDVWLGATVIQIVGIVLVVTRYLFPKRDLR